MNKRLEQTKKEPVGLGNEKEWKKEGAKEDANRRCNYPERYNNQGQALGHNCCQPQQRIEEGCNRLGDSRCFQIAQDILRVIRNPLRIGLADLIRKGGCFVGDQVVEVAAKAWDRRIVVIHHRESKTVHHTNASKLAKLEPAPMFAGGQS